MKAITYPINKMSKIDNFYEYTDKISQSLRQLETKIKLGDYDCFRNAVETVEKDINDIVEQIIEDEGSGVYDS